MNKIEALQNRKSVRKYLNRKITGTLKIDIENTFKNLTALDEKNRIEWNIDSSNECKYNIYSLKTKWNNVDLVEFGFEGEQVVINLTQMGLGTLWHAMGGIKNSPCNITSGYEESNGKKTFMQKMVSNITKPHMRKELSELIISGKEFLNEENREILECARLAPSAMNKQPWGFKLLDEKSLSFELLSHKKEYNFIDLGILLANSFIAANYYHNNVKIERKSDSCYVLIFN